MRLMSKKVGSGIGKVKARWINVSLFRNFFVTGTVSDIVDASVRLGLTAKVDSVGSIVRARKKRASELRTTPLMNT